MNLLDKNILHVWYPIADIQKQVALKTAYLGKLRSSETAPHLLDLIKMTKDEQSLFTDGAQLAMADLHDALGKYGIRLDLQSFRWNEPMVEIDELPTIQASDVTPSIAIDGNRVYGTITFALPEFDTDTYFPRVAVDLKVSKVFQFKGTDIDVDAGTETHTIVQEPEYDTTTGLYSVTIDDEFELQGPTSNMSATTIASAEASLTDSLLIMPLEIAKNTWVHYDDKYIFIAADTDAMEMIRWYEKATGKTKDEHPKDGTMYDEDYMWLTAMEIRGDGYGAVDFEINDEGYAVLPATYHNPKYSYYLWEGEPRDIFELLPCDMSQSIHFMVEHPKYLSTNYLQPMDIAIKEALVCHIISDWLGYSYPQEQEVWSMRYAKALQDVYRRLNVFRPQVQRMRPRWL